MKVISILLATVTMAFASLASAQQIDQSRGVDQRVDYNNLANIGPWDDRNYQLTLDDIQLLAPNEDQLLDLSPAFFRVITRRNAQVSGSSFTQYPRATFNFFKLRFGGYLIDNRITDKVTLRNGQFILDTSAGLSPIELIESELRGLTDNVRVTDGAESSITINPVNPDIVVAGLNGSGQDMFFSDDGGETWTESVPLVGATCCDPGMAWSSDASLGYVVALGGNDVWFYRTSDNGQTWTDLEADTPGDPRRELFGIADTGEGGALDDKEFIHVDRFPTSPFLDNIYISWHQLNVLHVATSTDNGNTFNIVDFTSDPRGIGSDLVTDAAGNVYHFWPDFTGQTIQLSISSDGGQSFTPSSSIASTMGNFIFPIPSMESRQVFIYVSAAADLTGGPFDGNLYAAWTDSTTPADQTSDPNTTHARIQVARSTDNGATWTITNPHETADELTVDRWHQWLEVDPNGNVHVIYYDTREFLPNRDGVDVFHSVSTDGGVTFSAPERITTESSPNIPGGFEFGDYNGYDIGPNGGIAVFTDNRASVDVYVAPAGEATGVELEEEFFDDGFEAIPVP